MMQKIKSLGSAQSFINVQDANIQLHEFTFEVYNLQRSLSGAVHVLFDFCYCGVGAFDTRHKRARN
jgi:hypothetical protein